MRTVGQDCGSGCDGIGRPWDSAQPGLGEGGQKLLERDVARRIKEHQRRCGNDPCRLAALGGRDPGADGQLAAAAGLRRSPGRGRRRRPCRLQLPQALTALGVGGGRDPPQPPAALPKVAMVLDTSGSMDDHLLAQSLAEVDGVLRGLGVGRRHLKIVCCDAKAFEAQKVCRPATSSCSAAVGPIWGRGWPRRRRSVRGRISSWCSPTGIRRGPRRHPVASGSSSG